MFEFSEFKILHHLDRIHAICRGELPVPVTFEIDLTNACNHRCIWCLDNSYNTRINTTLKEFPLLQFAGEMISQGVKSIVFKGGGEPLLYFSFSKLTQQLKNKGLDLGLITNGEIINRHLEAIPYLNWIRISLDAASAKIHQKLHKPFKSDSFQNIVDNLYQISTSVFTGVLFIVHPENICEMEDAAHLARDVGCRYIAFKRVIGEEAQKFTPKMMREIDELLIKIRKEHENQKFQILGTKIYHFYRGYKNLPYDICLAHHLIGILGSDGNLYPCCTLRGEVEYSYGSIYKNSFKEIWFGEKRKEVLEKINQKECINYCLGRNTYFHYDHYNQLLEYLTKDKEKVGHIDFL